MIDIYQIKSTVVLTLTVLVVSTSFNSHIEHKLSGQERIVEIDPAEIEKARQFYKEHNIQSDPFLDTLDAFARSRKSYEHRQLIEQNRFLLFNFPGKLRVLQNDNSILNESQQAVVSGLVEKYEEKLVDLLGKEMVGEGLDFDRIWRSAIFDKLPPKTRKEFDELKSKFLSDVLAIFSDDQLRQLKKMHVFIGGLPQALVDSPVGTYKLKLTEAQRNKIREDSRKLAADMEKAMAEFRERAKKIVSENLSPKQQRLLEEVYSPKTLEKNYEKNFSTLLLDHKLPAPANVSKQSNR